MVDPDVSPLDSAETILREKGGRLDPNSVDGAAGQHVQDSVGIFRGYLESIVVPGQEAVTRSTPPSRIAHFEYVRRWDVNAWATLAAEGPLVLFHAGIPFSLFEYFNALLAHRAVLHDLDGNAEELAPFESPSRDFTPIMQGNWPRTVPLSAEEEDALGSSDGGVSKNARRLVLWSHYLRRRPRSEVRQALAHQLYLLSVHFLFCHELGHIDRGHLEFQFRRNRSYALSEFAVAGGSRPVPDQTALELEADHYATVHALSPFLGRKKRGRYPSARLGDAEAGTAECYRLVLFSIGALFLALDHQQQPRTKGTWWSRLWTRFAARPAATHPDSLTRVRAALAFAQMTAAKSDSSSDAIDSASKTALMDLVAVAALLELDVDRLVDPVRLDETATLITRLGELEPELADCRAAVADRYFQSGRPVTLAEARAKTKPVDLYRLRDQSLAFYVDGEKIEIPFLHEDSPVSDFLSNSRNWERAGYVDNAFVYARLAIQRAMVAENKEERASAERRLKDVSHVLGPHLAIAEELVADHGLVSHLAERLVETGDSQPQQPRMPAVQILEAFCAMRPREALYRLRLADIQFTRREFAAALCAYDLAEKGDLPSDGRVAALVGSGNCLAELGKTDNALVRFRDALKFDHSSSYAWTNLVICLVRGGRAQAAVDAADEALATDQQHAEYWFLKAAACKTLGDQTQVKFCTDRALALDPTSPKYLLARGQLAHEEKQFRDAVELYTRALDVGADPAAVKFRRGRAFIALGDVQAAKVDFGAVRDAGGELAVAAGRAMEILARPQSDGKPSQ